MDGDIDILTFDEAINASSADSRRHLLLGNGFSISCSNVFSYDRLLESADFSELFVDSNRLFEITGTADFERAIELLRWASRLVTLYPEAPSELAQAIARDAESLKEILAKALANNHLNLPTDIANGRYQRTREFLAKFSNGKIYTLSYDLLLYWTVMQELTPPVNRDDGFRASEEDPGAEWVIWNGLAGPSSQDVYYLHGGLHLYEDIAGSLRKITWVRTRVPLIEQIRNSLMNDLFPLIITEGTSSEKMHRVSHSPYLHRGFRSLSAIEGSIFIHGHSLASNDEHVISRIEHSKVDTVYVSVYGDISSESNRHLLERSRKMPDNRMTHRPNKPLEVRYYQSETTPIW